MELPDDIAARYPDAETFQFGDSATLNNEILTLVRAGRKTVSCDAIAAFHARHEPLPVVGRTDIACDWDGRPQLALRTVDVQHIPFDQMPETLIADQGEFRDLDHWRKGYEAYLSRAGQFGPDIVMLVERFEVVEDFGEAAK